MIVIDPGHGGSDPGALGNGLKEKDLNLLISNYMYDRFKELGADVKITRDTDETLSPTDRVNRVLNAYGNKEDVVVISNHINAGGGEGAEVIYALRNDDTLSKLVLDEIGKTGQITRKVYQRTLPNDSSKDYYFIHRNTGVTEPILVEYGFIDTKADAEKLKNNYEKYAEAVVKAVSSYIGLKYTPPATNEFITYTVKKGDSLYSIAKTFNTTIQNIKSLNNLTSDKLSIGQILLIDNSAVNPDTEYITYTVKSGDNLYNIAKIFNTTVDEIKKLNNLTSDILSIGQILKIKEKDNENPNPPPTGDTINYIVKKGDSLYSIANMYNTTVDIIKKLNNLTSDILNIGQQLLIPKKEDDNYLMYTVKKGDSLYKIAQKYNTTVDEIRKLNNLNTNLLSIGQQLLIPKKEDNNYLTYTVNKGDSLYKIAQKYNTTVNEIRQLNNLSNDLLSIGQILLIPNN